MNTSSSCSSTWSAASSKRSRPRSSTITKGTGSTIRPSPICTRYPSRCASQCLNSFLESRVGDAADQAPPANYEEWIHRAFGRVFADTFPAVYTRKYWTREPADLGTDWIGKRVYYPKVEDVVTGAKGPLGRSTYWVNLWRYPSTGGFFTYTHKLADGARIEYGKKLVFDQLSKTPARICGRHQGEFRDAGDDPAAAGAD